MARLCDLGAETARGEGKVPATGRTGTSQGRHRASAHSGRTVVAMTTTTGPAAGSRALLTRPDGTALRVLVVDDESSICELLSMALRYEGWDVRTAPDGTAAVRTA